MGEHYKRMKEMTFDQIIHAFVSSRAGRFELCADGVEAVNIILTDVDVAVFVKLEDREEEDDEQSLMFGKYSCFQFRNRLWCNGTLYLMALHGLFERNVPTDEFSARVLAYHKDCNTHNLVPYAAIRTVLNLWKEYLAAPAGNEFDVEVRGPTEQVYFRVRRGTKLIRLVEGLAERKKLDGKDTELYWKGTLVSVEGKRFRDLDGFKPGDMLYTYPSHKLEFCGDSEQPPAKKLKAEASNASHDSC